MRLFLTLNLPSLMASTAWTFVLSGLLGDRRFYIYRWVQKQIDS